MKKKQRLFVISFKENFKQAKIHNGDKVAILFETNGFVIAIGNIGQDLWIDVDNNFLKKTFKDLGIIITSLKVY